MPKFKPYNHKQSAMVFIHYEDQLRPGTFEHAVHHLLSDKLDLSRFYGRYKNDQGKGGHPAYDPAILLRIILFAYSKGTTSSREIAWCCEHHIIFKALACEQTPHWTTIASFVSSHDEEIQDLFEQVLLVCDQQGLLGKELFAIDGCKMPSNASKEWSGTHDELRAKRKTIRKRMNTLIKAHRAADSSGVDTRTEREKQTIETLDAAQEKIGQFLKGSSPRMGEGKRPKEVQSNITDNESLGP